MSYWVRLWEDMPTDPKWRVVAKRSGRTLAEVIAVFVFMMTNAGANASERGRLQNWDDEDVGAALDMDGEHVAAIREAMQGKTLEGDNLSGWDRRQPKREDNSAERSRAWREEKKRRRAEETAKEPEQTLSERTRTNANAEKLPDKESDTDSEIDVSSLRSETNAREARSKLTRKKQSICASAAEDFNRFWEIWPNKVGKPAAERAFFRVHSEAKAVIEGVPRYVAETERLGRSWLNPATFLNQRRWEDSPAPSPTQSARASPAKPPEKRNPFFQAYEELMGELNGKAVKPHTDDFRGETLDLIRADEGEYR